jgi:flagellar hook-length control protein FliK
MIHEISNTTHSTPYQDSDMEKKAGEGENVKEAFVALLQGILGILPGNKGVAEVVDAPKMTDERKKEEESNKETQEDSSREAEVSSARTEKTQTFDGTSKTKNENVSSHKENDLPEKLKTVKNEATEEKSTNHTARSLKEESADTSHTSLKVNTEHMQKSERVEIKAFSEKFSTATEHSEAAKSPSNVQGEARELHNEYRQSDEGHIASSNGQAQAKERNHVSGEMHKTFQDIAKHLDMVLPDEKPEVKNDIAKAVLNMLVADTQEAASSVLEEYLTQQNHMSPLLSLAGILQEYQAADTKSLSGVKSDTGAMTTIGKGVSDKMQSLTRVLRAEAGAEARQQTYVEKVKEVLARVAQSRTSDSVTVKIDPPHLGEVTVRVVQKGKEVYAKLSADSSEVEQVLRTKMNELNNILQNLGYKADQVHVTIGTDAQETPFFSNAFSGGRQEGWGTREEKRKFVMQGESGTTASGLTTAIHANRMIEEGWVA